VALRGNPRNLLTRRRRRRAAKRGGRSVAHKEEAPRERGRLARGTMARGLGARERATTAQHDERRIVPPSKRAAEWPRPMLDVPVNIQAWFILSAVDFRPGPGEATRGTRHDEKACCLAFCAAFGLTSFSALAEEGHHYHHHHDYHHHDYHPYHHDDHHM
jgi:hypothetical protein